MKRFSFVALCAVALVVALLFSGETRRAEAAVTCSPMELSSCLEAIMSSTSRAPSDNCCSKLREQTPCFCGYLKDPSLKQFVDNPNTRRVATTCGVEYPQC